MITIHNLHIEKMNQPFDFRVDRKSVLGNPYFMQNEKWRDEVCDKYELWFTVKYETDESIIKELRLMKIRYVMYGKLRLFCWCAPKRCHAQTIKQYLEGS